MKKEPSLSLDSGLSMASSENDMAVPPRKRVCQSGILKDRNVIPSLTDSDTTCKLAPQHDSVISNNIRIALGKGYCASQIEQLTQTKDRVANLKALVSYHDALAELGYSHQQITQIAKYRGGERTLQEVLKSHSDLLSHGFSLNNITQLASRDEAFKKIAWILQYDDLLLFQGYTPKECVEISEHEHSDKIIYHIYSAHAIFYSLRIDKEQILTFVRQGITFVERGSANQTLLSADSILRAISDNYMGLKYLAFNVNQMIDVITHFGAQSLYSIDKVFFELKNQWGHHKVVNQALMPKGRKWIYEQIESSSTSHAYEYANIMRMLHPGIDHKKAVPPVARPAVRVQYNGPTQMAP
ncbi:MAG: hypothetical protein VXW87_03240 [Pseudomonadota bacterium]|nr:hypothetical protein [Pseudomonadota bacterium]